MDDLAKEFTVAFFDKSLAMHGDSPHAVRWTPQGQILHYRTLLDVGDLQNSSILDYGCGKGDFFGFLKAEGITAEYRGTDINPRLIELAQRKYPEADFRVFDIEQEDLDRDFDYILLCGVFNLKVAGIEETVRSVITRLFRSCRTALGFNALSTHAPEKNFDLNYTDPEELFRFAVTSLSSSVVLRHDRLPYDFTLFVYRRQNAFVP